MSSKIFSTKKVKKVVARAEDVVKEVFQAVKVPITNALNHAGATAYSMQDEEALAQMAMTGCFNATFYTSPTEQLKVVRDLSAKVSDKFLAQLAIHSRREGAMKDMPAVLLAILSTRNSNLMESIFTQVIDNPKMLRNFVQVMRSGAIGRKSLGTVPKRCVQQYLSNLTADELFRANVGNDPSLSDIIKMAHPSFSGAVNETCAYILGKKHDKRKISKLAKALEDFREGKGELPNVPFQMLTALPLTDDQWKQVARQASWTQTRMNLNSFHRHNVFKDSKMVDLVASRLSNAEEVKNSKVFPYQLFTTFLNTTDVDSKIRLALQDAVEVSLENIPKFSGKVHVMVDTSGSMSNPVTGHRGSVTTKTRCIDAAALIASAIVHKNPHANVIPFDTTVHKHGLNPRDSVMTNAQHLAGYGGGGTDCSAPFRELNAKKEDGDTLIMISDNESWYMHSNHRGTPTQQAWQQYKVRNPNARLVLIDLTPNTTAQATSEDGVDVMKLGGFNDNYFTVINSFFKSKNGKSNWVKEISKIHVNA